MLTALTANDNQKVIASKVLKADGPFICPECATEMILRKGMLKTHHFAHKPPMDCVYGVGESEEHRRCKIEIYESLVGKDGLTCELEKKVGNVRPDIYVESKKSGKAYAIEVQLSNLPLARIIERTREYYRLGIYVLWLPRLSEKHSMPRYSPSIWEKWLHATYFGRVYYWSKGLQIVPVHFDPYKIEVDYSEWYEDGDLVSVGGYERYSKRYRTPQKCAPIQFPDGFRGVDRGAWAGGDIEIPPCKIVIERKP